MMEALDEFFEFDGSLHSWSEIFRHIHPTPGVAIIFGGEQVLSCHAAGCFLTLISLYDEKDNRIFRNVGHFVPQYLGSRNAEEDIRACIHSQLIALGESANVADRISQEAHVRGVSQLDGIALVNESTRVPEKSAVVISCTQLFRFGEIVSNEMETVKSWIGTEYRLITREHQYFDHLVKLTRLLLPIARERETLFVLLVEEYLPILNDFPIDLFEDPDLAILSVPAPEFINRSTAQLEQWLKRSKSEDIEAIIDEVKSTVSSPDNQALIVSKIFFYDQQFYNAWAVLEPHLDSFKIADAKQLMSICQTAVSAGRKKEATELLAASVQKGLEAVEDIHNAYILSDILDHSDINEACYTRLLTDFPDHPITLDITFYKYFDDRKYDQAAEVAERLRYDDAVTLCQHLGAPTLDAEAILLDAKRAGKYDEACIAAALEAFHRGQIEISRKLAKCVPDDSKFASQSMRVRVNLLGEDISQIDFDSSQTMEELKTILKFVALHPNDLDTRFSLESLLEEDFGERLSLIPLSLIVFDRLQEGANAVEIAAIKSNSAEYNSSDLQSDYDEGDLVHFFEALYEDATVSAFVIGKGELTNRAKQFVNSDLLEHLVAILQFSCEDINGPDDIQHLNSLLHAICLVCKELHDPVTDLRATCLVIGTLARYGQSQQARDLGEGAVTTIASGQNLATSWRMSQAWWCYAEAFHRTHNPFSALRCLCLCLLSWQGEVVDERVFGSFCNLATRIYRDLGIPSLALQAIELDRRIGIVSQYDAKDWHQLEVTELSIRLTSLRELLIEELAEISDKVCSLLEDETSDIPPLMSIACSVIREFDLREVEGDPMLRQLYNSKLDSVDASIRFQLNTISNESPTAQDLIEGFKRYFAADHLNDAAYQTRPLQIMALSAVSLACKTEDRDLFLAASLILSQPALSFAGIQMELADSVSSQKADAWIRELYQEGADRSRQILDANALFRETLINTSRILAEVDSLSVVSLQGCLEPDEALLLLLPDAQGNLCRMSMTQHKCSIPVQLDDSIWSTASFKQWRQKYPRGYGDWRPAPDPFTDEIPTESDIKLTTMSLGIGQLDEGSRYLVVPDSSHFGFPFRLSQQQCGYVGAQTSLAIIPSIIWFSSIRTKTETSKRKPRIAWLGSSSSQDWTLHYLRDKLTPTLEAHGIYITNDDAPKSMVGADLAIVASHGGVDNFMQFREVSDGENSYSPQEFSRHFVDCRCVVLFVCNSGRSDDQFATRETLGLVTELLRRGVSAVIAPPWPLHVDVAEIWLPAFLEAISQGDSVGVASHDATLEVKTKHHNPCGWGAFHVYGEPNLIFAPS